MHSIDTVKIVLVGVTFGLLVAMALYGPRDPAARAADSSSTGGLVALTAQAGSSQKDTALFLVDTQSKHIALYVYDGNNFQLNAARSYMYDLGIHEAGKRAGITVSEAKKLYELDAAAKPGDRPPHKGYDR